MTDVLAIQAVNPQVKRKDNTMPYALGGAAIGAVAGGLSPIGVTKQKYDSYEAILKESNDTFEKNINKGGDNKSFWETAKQHKEAVDKAYSMAEKGDIVLLSPCCASFDLFKNYEDRGLQFKQCVRAL